MQNHYTKTLISRLTAIGAATLLAGLTPLHAQTPAGSNGRALDANQQVGSTGVNSLEGQIDYRRRNDMVTGNVGGGRGFQDNVGYGAVGEFRDNLGSDTLFNFRAQSLPSSPGYFNAATLGGVGQDNVSVYRSFTNRVAQPQGPGLLSSYGGYYTITPDDASYRSIYSSQLDTRFGGGPALGAQTPGLALQAFNTAPTVGLDGQPVFSSDVLSQRMGQEARDAGTYQAPENLGDSLRYDTNLFDPFGKSSIEESNKQQQMIEPGQLPPAMLIGQQLQTQFDPGAAAQALDPTRSRQVMDSVFKRLDKQDALDEDADPYVKLLRSIHDRKKAPTAPDQWTDALEAPTDTQLTEAERAYDAVMKDIYGENYQTRKRSTTTKPDDATDGSGEEVGDVVDQLNYDLPRLETLASNKQTRVANLTREAEAALAEGKYLTAEARYRQLLLDVKGDPMPRVGLIHAQLGAGMFRSAGMNLRALFVQHPELIAARYDAKLLPPQDRLQWVQREMQTVISQGEGGKDAPLLMAYLGYQAGSEQVVRYGMALAQSESPRDPLLAVIREIWLDEADSSSDGN